MVFFANRRAELSVCGSKDGVFRNETKSAEPRFIAVDALRRVRGMEDFMLGWALTFLVIALIAALLGFGGIAGTAVGIAKIIFFVAIVLFLISAIAGAVRGRRI
jgi:uncharacterized membrane protein YtjA (UPF0391 family)